MPQTANGLVVADTNEYHYLTEAFTDEAVIVRAHNSTRSDNKWLESADIAQRKCKWWAAYQYLVASIDPVLAADRFLGALAGFRPNVLILDLEEGTGDQHDRQHAWLDRVANDTHSPVWTYTGYYFARAHHLDDNGKQYVTWEAAYGQQEPKDDHTLWQFSDAYTFVGVVGAADASVFHGNVNDLIRITSPTTPPPLPPEDEVKLFLLQGDGPSPGPGDAWFWTTDWTHKSLCKTPQARDRKVYELTRTGHADMLVTGPNSNPIKVAQQMLDEMETV